MSAGAELGATNDPRALIPGSPETIEDHVRTLARQAEKFEDIGGKLAGFGVPGWQGAASDAFDKLIAWLPPQWFKAADSMAAAAASLTHYADTLRWAQQQGQVAIDLWEEGRRVAEHAGQAVDEAADQAVEQAEELQQHARDLLDRAREQLARQAADAARRIGTIEEATGSAIGGLVDAITSGWDAEGSASVTIGRTVGTKFIPPEHGKLGRYRAYAYLLHQVAQGKLTKGDLTLTGKLETMVGIEANLQAALNNRGLTLEVEETIGVKSTATGRVDWGPLGLDGKAEGMFGVRGRAGLRATTSGVSAKAGVFAGARGSVRGAVDVGGVGAGATAEGWAGVGAEAGVDIGMGDDGKFHIKGNAGAALGLGGEVGFDLQVDGGKLTETARSATHAIGHGIEEVGKGIEDVGHDVRNVGKSISGWLG